MSLASEALHVAGSTAPSTSRATWWPTRYVVLAALAFAPLVLPLLSEARAYLPNFAVATDVALEGELRAFSAWLDARRAEDPDFYRVAYVDGSEDHDLKAAIAFTGRPALHSGFTPATTYRHRYDRVDPALYRVLGVRYVVARSPLTEPWAEPLERFGRLHVHGLRAPRTERVTLEGEGRVEVLRFEPEGAGVELRVSGAAPGDRLVLHVGSFSGWRAWRDGAPLEVESRPLAGHEGFVSVPAADGRTRLAFVRGTSEHVGLVVSLLAMLALGLLFARSRWPAGVTARLDRAGAFLGARTRRLAAGAVTLVALVFLAVALTRPPPRALVDRLAGIQVDLVRGDRADRCEREGDRHQCSDEDWNYVGRKYQWFAYPGAVHPTEGEVRRCVWAHPVVGADLRLRVPGVRLGDAIEGGHALMNRGAGALSLTAYVDGEVVDQVGGPTGPAYIWRPFSLRTGALAGRVVDLDLVVRSTGAGPWHYCFDVDLPR